MNATIFPMGPPRAGKPGWDHRAQAMLWSGDTLHLVGSNDAVRAAATRLGITPRDLGGRVVLPGFVDAHTHFLHVGVKSTRPDLRGAKSRQEALARLARFLHDHPGSHHVIGEGWDESEWPDGRRPTRNELDAVVAAAAKDGAGPLDRPVVLRRICGHIAVASSGALPLVRARWDSDDAVDLHTGLLTEAPSLYLNEVLPSTPAELDRALQQACAVAHALGVTTVGDYSQAPYRAALQRAAARGTLTVRIASSIYVQQLDAEVAAGFRTGRAALGPSDLHATAKQGLTRAGTPMGPVPGRDGGAGTSPWLRDGGLKVFLDGSLGGHTAHLREPYLDLPAAQAGATGASPQSSPAKGHAGHDHGAGPCGSRIWTDAEVDHYVGLAHAQGIQVHAHAIGDAAIDQGLDAFSRLAAHEDLEGRGWHVEPLPRLPRIENGSLAVHPDAAGEPETAVASGARAAMGATGLGHPPSAGQPNHSTPSSTSVASASLRHRFEHYEIVHDDQVARTVELGVVASSQPNFVGEWSAKGGMYEGRLGPRYALNNRFATLLRAGVSLAFGSDGMPFGPLVGLQAATHHPLAAERLTPQQAIWHYTTAAAWSLHWESHVGSLEPGKAADFIVLDQTDLAAPPNQWRLRETYAGGSLRFPTASKDASDR